MRVFLQVSPRDRGDDHPVGRVSLHVLRRVLLAYIPHAALTVADPTYTRAGGLECSACCPPSPARLCAGSVMTDASPGGRRFLL